MSKPRKRKPEGSEPKFIQYRINRFKLIRFDYFEPDVPKIAPIYRISPSYGLNGQTSQIAIGLKLEVFHEMVAGEPFCVVEAATIFDVRGIEPFLKEQLLTLPDTTSLQFANMSVGLLRGTLTMMFANTALAGQILPVIPDGALKPSPDLVVDINEQKVDLKEF